MKSLFGYIFSFAWPMSRHGRGMKIFALALHRSGSMSMNEALEILGFRSLFTKSIPELYEGLDHYDAFTHDAVLAEYKELDARHPGSKFVFLRREKESWIDTCRRFPNLEPGNEPGALARVMLHKVYRSIAFDEAIYRQVYDDIIADVSDHFADRPDDLLWMSIVDGDGWETVCDFLDKPIPSKPFPVKNTARQTYLSPWYQLKLAIRVQGSRVKQALLRVRQRA